MSKITEIEQNSPLFDRVNIGDSLISIDGNEILDVLDYKFYSYDSKIRLVFKHENGENFSVDIQKEEGEDLGLTFESYLMDSAKSCSNHCVFCFIDQLPKGMRKTLYFKDDDARLSFLTGNYITLTNLTEHEISRICKLHISPVNISVHATDSELRKKLLGNKKSGEILAIMRRLADAGITMNCQIVCCPNLNDGDALKQTLNDLKSLHPAVNSVSIVPVGLTKFRENLHELTLFDKESAISVLDMVANFAKSCKSEVGSGIFFCADEFYLKAERELPSFDEYEDFPQLENGVGMLSMFEKEFLDELSFAEPDEGSGKRFSVATGTAAEEFIKKLLLTAKEKCDKIDATVYAIENEFFGKTINVSGLITGGDILKQLSGKDLGDAVLIPQNMLRQGENVFLDDMTTDELSEKLGVPVISTMQDGGVFLQTILGN